MVTHCMTLVWNVENVTTERNESWKSIGSIIPERGKLHFASSLARSAIVNFHGARRGKASERASRSKKDRESKSSAWRRRGREERKKGGYALRWQKEGNDLSGISFPPRATLVARWVAPLYLPMARTLIRTPVANLYMTAWTRTTEGKISERFYFYSISLNLSYIKF